MSDVEDKYVCEDCIEDSGLQHVVRAEQDSQGVCSYCYASPASYLADVIEQITASIRTVYGAHEDNYDHDGNPPEMLFISDVFSEIQFTLDNEELMRDIESWFGDRTYSYDIQGGFLDNVRRDAWEDFQYLIKHRRRYTFWSVESPHNPEMDELLWSPSNLLENVRKDVDKFSLLRRVDTGLKLWRVRVHKTKESLSSTDDFTSPPIEDAIHTNRMSPAGIPMFYGAEDFTTACAETIDSDEDNTGYSVTGMEFSPTTDFVILDLVDLPARKSFFDPFDAEQRRGINFLRSFADDLSKPIKKDGKHHIKYVPTQVFTEFVRHGMKADGGESIHGIRFRSSRNAKDCYVIFVEKEGCLPPEFKSSMFGGKKRNQFLSANPDTLQTQQITS
ncbi:RES domain-containing protein [bacterium]|nr:RES domain-containing protein [bacterium]